MRVTAAGPTCTPEAPDGQRRWSRARPRTEPSRIGRGRMPVVRGPRRPRASLPSRTWPAPPTPTRSAPQPQRSQLAGNLLGNTLVSAQPDTRHLTCTSSQAYWTRCCPALHKHFGALANKHPKRRAKKLLLAHTRPTQWKRTLSRSDQSKGTFSASRRRCTSSLLRVRASTWGLTTSNFSTT
eukprot:3933079-Rhodomonas_salina.1